MWVDPPVGESGEPPAWSGPEFAAGRAPALILEARAFDELVRPCVSPLQASPFVVAPSMPGAPVRNFYVLDLEARACDELVRPACPKCRRFY